VIVGVGNPVRGDDAVGLRIACELGIRLAGSKEIDVIELCAGGLRLMEAIAGYDRAVVVDASETGAAPGTVRRLDALTVAESRNLDSMHNGSLASALRLGRVAGLRLPEDIRVWAVEAGDVETFGGKLTPAVEASVEAVVEDVLREVSIA